MRVLVVSAYYPGHGGGIEIIAQQIISHLSDRGFRFTWCAADCEAAPEDFSGSYCAPLKASNFFEKVVKIPFPLISPGAVLKLWKLVSENDVIYLHDFIYPSNLFTWLFAKMRGKPVIITQHIGLVPYRNPLLRLSFASVNHTLGKLILNRSSQVVFIANHVQDYFAGICGGNKPHWRYIPNGVNAKFFNNSTGFNETDINQVTRLHKDRFLLFVGRFVEKKGLLFLKELVRSCDDLQWVFAGKGPIDPGSWGLENVTVIRHIDHACVAQLYRRASLLVLPSVGEGFPLVIQEAVACGTPVLTTLETSGGCAEADSFLFKLEIAAEDSVESWGATIRELLADHQKLESASNEGLRYARENWNWSAIGEQYEQVFRQCHSVS